MNKEQLEEIRDKINNLKSRRVLITQVSDERKKEYTERLKELKEKGIDIEDDSATVVDITAKLHSLSDELFSKVPDWEDMLNLAKKKIM